MSYLCGLNCLVMCSSVNSGMLANSLTGIEKGCVGQREGQLPPQVSRLLRLETSPVRNENGVPIPAECQGVPGLGAPTVLRCRDPLSRASTRCRRAVCAWHRFSRQLREPASKTAAVDCGDPSKRGENEALASTLTSSKPAKHFVHNGKPDEGDDSVEWKDSMRFS